MPTPENTARLKVLYGRLGDLTARAAGMPPEEAGRAEVYRNEAKLVAKEIQAIKDSYKVK